MAPNERRPVRLPAMSDGRARAVLSGARTTVTGVPAELLAARAARLGAPLLLRAPTPAGRRRLARALHAVAGRDGPLTLAVPEMAAAEDGATLLIELESLGDDAALVVECLVDDAAAWVLVAAGTEDALAAEGALGETAVELPGLTGDALVAVAREALRALAPPGAEVPPLSESAERWLASRTEATDPDEVRAWLRRALVGMSPGEALDLEGGASVRPARPDPASTTAATSVLDGAAAAGDARLEYVLAELAHELRNPLVTLKTVVDHLDELADDGELRARFRGLGSDAVTRMDALLDNLVTYGRLGAPAVRPLAVDDLVAEAVRDAEPALAGRRLRVRAARSDAACLADPEHLAFALRNLLVGIAGTAAPDGDVVVDASVNGVVRVRFASDADASTLQSLLAPDVAGALYDPAYQPLPFSLARAVLAKIGGRLDLGAAGDGGTALDVHLPVPDRPA